MALLPFDPRAHGPLLDLEGRLRELAGDAAYKAGRDYLKKGLVRQGAVAGTTGYATVTGSTDYRVSIAFADEVKVSCTCPAHRRSKYCKHVVAVCSALLEKPGDFAPAEPVTAPVKEKPAGGTKKKAPKASKAELQTAGLETVDSLLHELAAGGLMTLNAEKTALLAGAAELVRALKLRRMGNLIMQLQRAAGGDGGALEPDRFARLLIDLWLTRAAAGAHLEGRVTLDPRLAEELQGKTWRDEELEPISGLQLMEVAFQRVDDGEFVVESSFLADLAGGGLYTEKQITPRRLAAAGGKVRHRQKLLADEAGLYPGAAPRRIKLFRSRRAPLTAADAERLVTLATGDVADLRRQLVERLSSPFGPPDLPLLFRPAGLVVQGELAGAVDGAGRFVALDLPAGWRKELPDLLPSDGAYALFGLLALDASGLRLTCLSVISGGLRWGDGPVYPDKEVRRR